MRITSKGQVTIPVAIREKAGLLPGTEVDFQLDGDDRPHLQSQSAQTRDPRAGDCPAAYAGARP